MGYGPRFTAVFRQRARLVARVLRGGKPADIPVEQPTIFELVINLKAARPSDTKFLLASYCAPTS